MQQILQIGEKHSINTAKISKRENIQPTKNIATPTTTTADVNK